MAVEFFHVHGSVMRMQVASLLPAFLEHYRGLGVARFIFLDDRSSDGTREYLTAQPDCGLLGSELAFSQLVDGMKAHELWRSKIPNHYCHDQWTLVVDVDEFLYIPPSFRDVQSFVNTLDDRGERVVGAVMVDFYPSSIQGLEDASPPATKVELFERYPYFDACVHGHWIPEQNKFHRVYGGVRNRLMQTWGIEVRKSQSTARRVRERLRNIIGQAKVKYFNALHKVPLVRWRQEYAYLNAHELDASPAPRTLLPLAHFKFTGSLLSKIEYAIESGAYHNQSFEYRAYGQLLENMKAQRASFLGPDSRRFTEAKDFCECGLLYCELGPHLPSLNENFATAS